MIATSLYIKQQFMGNKVVERNKIRELRKYSYKLLAMTLQSVDTFISRFIKRTIAERKNNSLNVTFLIPHFIYLHSDCFYFTFIPMSN